MRSADGVVEVTMWWRGERVEVRHFPRRGILSIGAGRGADFVVPAPVAGQRSALVTCGAASCVVGAPPGGAVESAPYEDSRARVVAGGRSAGERARRRAVVDVGERAHVRAGGVAFEVVPLAPAPQRAAERRAMDAPTATLAFAVATAVLANLCLLVALHATPARPGLEHARAWAAAGHGLRSVAADDAAR